MECFEPFGKIAKPAIEFALKLSVQHLAYILHYKQRVDGLNGSVKDIKLARKRLNHQRDEAEKNLHNIEDMVIEWLRKVDEFVTKEEEFRNDEGHSKTQFHYFWNRYRLAKQAQEMAEDVKKLIDESPKFDEIAYRENVTSNDATLSNVDFVEFGSTKSTIEDIMAKLGDPTARMIGLCGPGGVGKSTLIKEAAKNARNKKLFNVVVKVDITANPNPQKIQEEIAYVLGLKLEGESENVRADCLRRRLKKEKENTLVIFDDLWDKLDLNKLGIPLDDDNDDNDDNDDVDDDDDDLSKRTNNDEQDLNRKMVKREKSLGGYKRCKILLISRYKKVLSDHIMNDDSIFTVMKLDDNDALMLFRKVARIPGEMSTSKQEIVKNYCAGLPMAIATVGRALRDKSESVWDATLKKLKKQELVGVHKSLEISTKMSYDHLENEELKSIFLLCAQMGHQPLVMDLVKYCYGLGILEGVYSLREAQERIHTSIQKLKDLGLLDECSSNHFNMQHMVRDAALSIAYKERNVFTLRNGKLDDWLELERCTSISICFSDVIDELPNVINCPQLKFFQIESDDPSLKIPESFFERMKKLRVLILTGIHLSTLPNSLKNLSNLRMICLERCTLDGNLSIIGELKKLTILSFSGSQMKSLPIELGCLDKLQLLDISNCSTIETIPPDLISRLTCLEELYIRKSLIKMLVDRETNQSQISFLSDLKHLHQLKVMDLSIPSAAILPKDLFFDTLNDYKIVIGDFKVLSVGDFRMPNKYEALRSLALQLKDGTDIHSWEGIKLLFKRVENLLLGELNGLQNGVMNVINELNLDGFQDLKHLSITNNTSIKYIINSTDSHHPRDVFPGLESLCLYKLWSIETICCSLVTNASFAKLKTIKVEMCAQLKNLFYLFGRNKFLGNLETIDVFECNSLKDIIEIPVNCVKVEFLKLHSLTLQSLPSFTSFCTIIEDTDHIEVTTAEDKRSDMAPPLFGERVEIPNLESLNLSSVNIHKIWSDQPLSSFCFQNLIKLVVKDCNKLRYLCSLSVANGLRKLKGLFISGCPKMDKIFSMEGRHSSHKVCVFPKLEEIHLSKMSMLSDIWPAEVSVDSFSSLISVHIEGCKKINKIFPSHMEGWFASLDSLKVVECKSVEVIFEINDSHQKDASGGIDTNLQHMDIHSLPNLKQVWSKDPGGILNFKKLQSIEVSSCYELRNIFPASVAKDARKLEYMSIQFCGGVVEIVACGDGPETHNEPLMFPKLTKMMLNSLSNIKRFYGGRHAIKCPKLKRLVVNNCKKLKAFPTKPSKITIEEEKPVFLAEKVFPKLEYLDIDFDEAQKWLWSNILKYRMYHLKELSLISVKSGELLCRQFLYRMPNLEKLHLFRTEHLLKEPSEPCLGTVLHLKELVLWYSEVKDLGFERDPVLQRLKLLRLRCCHKLINLAPPLVSLTYMTYLEVKFCRGLTSLMAFSTAKSLVHLKTMKVIGCDNAKEIVTTEGSEEGKGISIVFSKLITIQLVGLKNLTSFCSYENCEFKFPSLEILIVRECPMMKTFSESPASTPKLQNVLAVEGKEESKWQWEGDLNATIQKVFNDKVSFTYTKDLHLFYYPQLIEQLWQYNHSVQQSIFRDLKRLNVYKCDSLVHIIPYHLIPCFENLEELQVRRCSAAQVIFNIKEISWKTKALGIIRLKKLSLEVLPNLEHVWDKDPEGIIGLQVLQYMHVRDCDCLKSLLPASVAKDLTRLAVLEVTRCGKLEEIFSEDVEAKEGEIKMFVFSCLISLTLKELQGFKYFYPGLHTLEWPVLEQLCAFKCELVTLKFPEHRLQEHVFVQIEKVIQMKQIPSLKKLSFGIGDTTVTWDLESGQLHFDKLQHFQEESDSVPLYGFLDMLPIIEKLAFDRCSFKEMFSAEIPNDVYSRILLHLKEIQVKYCGSLEKLVARTVSFSSLTFLEVERCYKLPYLFTSSTAKSLAQLKRMEIKLCKSIEEIVSKEGDETHEVEKIVFGQLQVLFLEGLHQLRCFYPGKFTLSFPCLEQVHVIDCSLMKTFSPVNEIAHSTKWFSSKYMRPKEENDLNSAVGRRFEEKFLEPGRRISYFNMRDSPLQEIWLNSRPIPELCFSNLDSFIVDGCQFLSDAVLPFNLLPFLTNLKTLKVRNCDNVKNIFDVKCITQDRTVTFSLQKLALSKLPNLENVWNEDPHGVLTMQLLQVDVYKCIRLASVFPTSVAKDFAKLENLVVEECKELVAIVAEDNAHPRGTNLELTFPCVKSLKLLGLPKFEHFYYCSLQCDIFKTFTHLETHNEDQVCIEKPTPNLQCLSLGENGLNSLKLIWHGELQRNLLQKLKVLTLCFHIGSDVFPYEILKHVPNIEKLGVSCSSFKEIFCCQSPNVEYTELLLQLKVLHLEFLSELVSIGLENSWIVPLLTKLETLQVISCFGLKILVPGRGSFSNLTYLEVERCNSLIYLFTSSTAKSLAQLKRMEIKWCDSIKEIVSKEGDESDEDEITFQQLNCLNLRILPKLESFYKGSLSFPSLDQLSVIGCEMMETLCPGTLKADKLIEVKLQNDSYAIRLRHDLNSTMRKAFLARPEKPLTQ